MTEIKVEKIVPSGICGNINNISKVAMPSKMRQKTNCSAEATHQVWVSVSTPEEARIVSACDNHVEDAKQFVQKRHVSLNSRQSRLEGWD